MLVPSILLFITIAKRAVSITITNEYISINGCFTRKTIYQNDIKSIDLISMQDLYLSIGKITISTSIELMNGEKIILADPFYKNITALKNFLNKNFGKKIKPLNSLRTTSFVMPDFETDFEKYSGSAYFNLRSVLFYGFVILILILVLTKPISSKSLPLVIILPIIYFGFGTQLYYFLISNKRIVVKNHLLPWLNTTYYVDDIIAINFESPYNHSEALRITTKDFNSRAYCAGSLRQKDWNNLKQKLLELKMYVIN